MKNSGTFWASAALLLLVAMMLVSRIPSGADDTSPGAESVANAVAASDPSGLPRVSEASQNAEDEETTAAAAREPDRSDEENEERDGTPPVRVEVVDPDGAPRAGLRVTLDLVRRDAPSSSSRIDDATTDASGIATFAGARDDIAERLAKVERFGITMEPEITVETVSADPPRARFETVAAMPDPVRLVVGSTGSVMAEVRDANGAPLEAGSLGISYRPAGSEASFRSTRRYVDVVDGTARYDGIGLGLELAATAWPASDGPAGTAKIAGPEYAGHEIHVRLQTGAPWPILVARLVDPSGAPIVDATIDTTVRLLRRTPRPSSADSDRHAHTKSRTDAEGRFRFVLRGEAPEGSWRQLLLFPRDADTFAYVTLDEATLRGTPAPGSTVDIGDLVVAPIPVLVSGRVVDTDGHPLRGAVLDASGILPGQSRSEKLAIDDRSSDADGHFTLRYPLPPPRIDLHVNERSRRFATLEGVESGTTGLEIVAHAYTMPADAGTVEGSVIADDKIAYDHLEVALALHGGSREKTQWAGRFRFEPVPVGTHAVVVRTRPARLVVRRIDDVVVTPGAVTADSRLAPIDIRGETRYLRLRLVHPDRSPIADTRFWIADATGIHAGRGSAETDRDGRFVVLVPKSCTEFELSANDYTAATVPFADDERDAVFETKTKD